jgi:hypothetical protein
MQTEMAAISRPPPPRPTQKHDACSRGSGQTSSEDGPKSLQTQQLYHTTSAINAVKHRAALVTRRQLAVVATALPGCCGARAWLSPKDHDDR